LVGDLLASNTGMLQLARDLGFQVEGTRESDVLRLSLAFRLQRLKEETQKPQ